MWLATLFALVACYQAAQGRSWMPKHGGVLAPHIVNGSAAPEMFFKYQVGLDIVRENGGSVRCGGALIGEHWVLTAGHCIQMYPDEKFKYLNVLLGAYHRDDYLHYHQVIYSDEVFMHPGWTDPKRDSGSNDIALIKLPKAAKLDDHVDIVRLPTQAEKHQSFVNWPVRVSGWGHTENRTNSEVLRYIDTHVVSNEQCEKEIKSGLFSDTNICTSGDGGKGLGPGDSGGPLVAYGKDGKPLVIGVCSFISGWGLGRPAAYTRVTKYIDWIDEIMTSNP